MSSRVKREALATKKTVLKPEDLARLMAQLALNKKVHDLVIIDVRGLSSYADFILVASARSARHVQGVADYLEEELYRENITPLGIEGTDEGQWVLMDYGDVVFHLFFEPVREFYDIEGLWMDATRIKPEDWGLVLAEPTEEDENK
ncbi:iojap-like protein [Thermodesulfatator indicus DSM 15286]|uniref:Ribosomal silencing factor RsfS n=1 Tax=Thermodesulfatator indicus (strain DSM 15286 / JCM 11887 / CIR29812) TaxID=667014 RepID=F8ADL0_THEID|nr:ribosome silencing factor [Thermodesulfatator indicus]AEH44885.1 iojap-like protein [Thermodesulfatator indicus DSM 15286]